MNAQLTGRCGMLLTRLRLCVIIGSIEAIGVELSFFDEFSASDGANPNADVHSQGCQGLLTGVAFCGEIPVQRMVYLQPIVKLHVCKPLHSLHGCCSAAYSCLPAFCLFVPPSLSNRKP